MPACYKAVRWFLIVVTCIGMVGSVATVVDELRTEKTVYFYIALYLGRGLAFCAGFIGAWRENRLHLNLFVVLESCMLLLVTILVLEDKLTSVPGEVFEQLLFIVVSLWQERMLLDKFRKLYKRQPWRASIFARLL